MLFEVFYSTIRREETSSMYKYLRLRLVNYPPHSQPRALRHTLLTNIMSLWIRAPRN